MLTSVTIDWSFDDGVAPPITGSQVFTGLNVATGNDTTFSATTINFTSSSYEAIIYTSLPNGIADGQLANDTFNDPNTLVSLSGNYTIGTTGNFLNFSQAAIALVERGICGPVVFTAAAGTYNDSIVLPEIEGASAINTITFRGVNSTTVRLTSSENTVPTVDINGGDYFTFSNLTISHTGTTDAWGIHLTNASDHNTIDSCVFDMPQSTNTDVVAIVASGSYTAENTERNNANYLTISNNTITGGEIGIHLEGASVENIGNQILNNTIEFTDDLGISADEQDSITIVGNTIRELQNTGGDGMLLNDIAFVVLTNNGCKCARHWHGLE